MYIYVCKTIHIYIYVNRYPKLDTFLKWEKALSALQALLSLFHPLGRVLLSDKQWLDPGPTERDESAGQYHCEPLTPPRSPGSGETGHFPRVWEGGRKRG